MPRRARRPARRRQRRQLLQVFTEGEATEPEYFDAVKRLQSAFVLRVDSRHGEPWDLVHWADEFKRSEDRRWRQEGLSPEGRTEVWCVFDRDEHRYVDRAIELAERSGVRVAFSHACFEFWLLLHYQDFGAPTDGNGQVVCQQLRRHLGTGKHVNLGDLAGRYATARERAIGRNGQHDRDDVTQPTKRDPSTNVYELVELLGVTY
ncbi:MAG: RloB family protein [Micromonosporaceae bacterium]